MINFSKMEKKMKVMKAKISKKGQITIPKEIRNELNSDYVEFIKEGDRIFIKKIPSVEEMAGSLNKYAKNKSKTGLKEDDAWSEHVKEKYRIP
ncbi:MAG: AbrB/MazE/SpoVT family DNA-binding domain-containing protein [Kosmotoga sp.]|nr:MAG: AbrB/MazE/SpoVT family DNA-binding domain-containing protein [Kosmotoga sp.]